MASITVRRLDESIKDRLRVRAARNRRSMEEEVRAILNNAIAVDDEAPGNLAQAIRRRIAPLGGVKLPVIPREPMRDPPRFRR